MTDAWMPLECKYCGQALTPPFAHAEPGRPDVMLFCSVHGRAASRPSFRRAFSNSASTGGRPRLSTVRDRPHHQSAEGHPIGGPAAAARLPQSAYAKTRHRQRRLTLRQISVGYERWSRPRSEGG